MLLRLVLTLPVGDPLNLCPLFWMCDASSKSAVDRGEPECVYSSAHSELMLVETFEQDGEDWRPALLPSESEDVVTNDFELSDVSLRDWNWSDPFRLTVPSVIKLPDIEETEMAERCLHAWALILHCMLPHAARTAPFLQQCSLLCTESDLHACGERTFYL